MYESYALVLLCSSQQHQGNHPNIKFYFSIIVLQCMMGHHLRWPIPVWPAVTTGHSLTWHGNLSRCSSWTTSDEPSPSMACLPNWRFSHRKQSDPFECSTVDVWAFNLHDFYTCMDALWPLTRGE